MRIEAGNGNDSARDGEGETMGGHTVLLDIISKFKSCQRRGIMIGEGGK